MILEPDLIFNDDEKEKLEEAWRRVDFYVARRRVGPSIGFLTDVSKLIKAVRQRQESQEFDQTQPPSSDDEQIN